jgi:23S rRNA pseudouridine955/2504/2580 synthase
MTLKKFRWSDSIIFEDEHYIVINKPPLLSVLSDRNDSDNLLKRARHHFPDIQICHRLDKETSGLIVFARDPESYRNLAVQFEHRKVKKVYHALCDGIHDFKKIVIDYPLYNTRKGMVKVDYRRGKASKTLFNTLKAFSKHTLIECTPITGRTHQIRVHLASCGAPITGDSKYGGKPFFLSEIKKKYNLKKFTNEEPLIKRFVLHAFQLEFVGIKGEKIKIEAPYPKDFEVVTRQLEKNIR